MGLLKTLVILQAIYIGTCMEQLDIIYEWKELDFAYPTPEARQAALDSGAFVPGNTIPMGLEVHGQKLFITVPRWRNGVPASLTYIDLKDNSTNSPVLIPYPNWEAHDLLKGKPEIVSPFRVRADKCNRLWVLDNGKIGSLENDTVKYPPALLIYDLLNDNLLRKYSFPDDQVKEDSGFANIAVEDTDCEDTYAYSGDLGKAGIVVYSWKKNETWRITHHYFHPDPTACDFSVKGHNFSWTDAIFGLSLSAPNADNFSTLYFHPMASYNEFAVSTEYLRNQSIADANFNAFKLLGSRGPNAQSSASFIDPKTGVLFYSLVNLNAVACWRTTNKEYIMKNQGRIYMDDVKMIYPTDIKVDYDENLWILSNRMPIWMYGKLDPSEVNFRVFSAPVLNAISHTACDVTRRSDILDKFVNKIKNVSNEIAAKVAPSGAVMPSSCLALKLEAPAPFPDVVDVENLPPRTPLRQMAPETPQSSTPRQEQTNDHTKKILQHVLQNEEYQLAKSCLIRTTLSRMPPGPRDCYEDVSQMQQVVPRGEEKVDHVARIRQQCVDCFKGPNLFKTIVVLVCITIVVYQVISCIQKLTNIPITTHSHFDFNKTIAYPSVTFCREPPYKTAKLEEYGLSSHPRFTSTWREFDFSKISLDDLWEEITYNQSDFFVQYGLDSNKDNVEVTSTLGFVYGRCFTLTPRRKDTQATKERGYSITLQHTRDDIKTTTSVTPPGYHVFVHYEKEPYTEVEVYNGGLVDYLYMNTGETLDVKLTVNEYAMISDDLTPCTNELNYSANYCTTKYVSDEVSKEANCSGPWMDSTLPRCDNYRSLRSLIAAYIDKYKNHQCDSCPRICRSLLYSAFVADRQKFYFWDSKAKAWSYTATDANLQTQIYIHFNNMMVTVFEEKYNYDWNLFLSDLGGSVGFLLGLSVIGLIGILGNIWSNILRPLICRNRQIRTPATISLQGSPLKNRY
ncbi:unnamed protein product [Leptosia nina]|uniref:Protein yellow n=1 Tax=Leptosia nina TaxID=320188 RepID=A0AAV1K1R8_9NEOP